MVRATVVMALLTLPGVALADDLRLQLGASAEYDSNVFRIPEDSPRSEKDDVVFRIVPRATFVGDEGDATYRLSYAVPFEQGIESHDNISDFDHLLNGNGTYRISEATELFLRDSFRYTRNVNNGVDDQDAPGIVVPEISTQKNRVLRNRTELGINHSFTPRLTGGASFGYTLFDTDQFERQDVNAFDGTANLLYALTGRMRLGGGVQISYQNFDDLPDLPGSENWFYGIFGTWVYQISETTSFSVSAGPTIIDTSQNAAEEFFGVPAVPFFELDGNDSVNVGGTSVTPPAGSLLLNDVLSCPVVDGQVIIAGTNCANQILLENVPANAAAIAAVTSTTTDAIFPAGNPGKTDDLQVTVFAQAQLTRRWTPTLTSSLSYRRQQATASGIGGSTVLDAVFLTTEWQITELWEAGVRLDWNQRKSLVDQTQVFRVVEPDDNAGMMPPSISGEAQAARLTGELLAFESSSSVDTMRWGAGVRLSRRITKNLRGTLRLQYNRQESDNFTRGRPSDFDDYLAILGFSYTFNPIRLWD